MAFFLTANIWDIRYFRSKDTNKRLERFAHIVETEDPDVVFIQESFNVDNRKKLMERLGKKRSFASVNVLRTGDKRQGEEEGYNHPSGIYAERFWPLKLFDTTGGLLTLSKYPILNHRFKKFGVTGKGMDERFCGKGYTLSYLETACGQILAVNTHLCSGSGSKDVRTRQVHQLLADMNDRQKTVVVGGDFNFDSEEEMWPFEDAGFMDSACGEGGMETYSGDNPYVSVSEIAALGHKKARLDRILVRPGDDADSAIAKQRLLGIERPVSDHFLYGVEILIGKNGTYI